MSRTHSYLKSAENVISQYRGEMPLAAFLKSFFAKDKKYGSRDRKTISALCYAYFRVAAAMQQVSVEQAITAGIFLTSEQPNLLLSEVSPEWNGRVGDQLSKKLGLVNITIDQLFPFYSDIGGDIDKEAFATSFLQQPRLFIRVRPQHARHVEAKLQDAQLSFEKVDQFCFSFENGTKLDDILVLNKEYVVQDLNSQKTFDLLPGFLNTSSSLNVWDCCAASGGKSIMAYDRFSNLNLTVSDTRQSILNNLAKRFSAAGIKNYHQFQADLTQENLVSKQFHDRPFDLIICDAPCSGSGTWSRTPEQLTFFKPEQIDHYNHLQKSIAGNVSGALRKGGFLLYITCSVFARENEEVVDFLQQSYPVKLLRSEYLKGYNLQADSMYAALFQAG